MIFIKLLLSSSLIYMTTMTITNPTNDEKSDVVWRNELNNNLSDTILPLHYLIRVVFHTDWPYLLIICEITIHIMFATQHINFYLPNSNWTVIKMGLTQICNEKDYKIKLQIYYGKNNVVMFDFYDVLLPGIYLLKIDLANDNFTTNALENFIKGREDILLMTHIQTKKQQIFPYWNNPELRIRFDISIKHDRYYTVLSNMPIQISNPAVNNTMLTYFHTTPLMSLDSIALIVIDYHRISNVANNKTVNMLYRPQLKSQVEFSLYIIQNITRYLQNSMSVLKTYVSFEKKVDHVVIFNLEDEVKQTLGFVFYREADIVYDENLDPIACKIRIAHLIARAMAQKYMSNLFSPSYWFDEWLNEGFKIYMETYIIEKVLPNFRMMDLFVVQVQHELFHLNTYVVINSVMDYCSYSEKYLYSSFSYVKGSIIWRMLELTLSSDIFSKGIDIYLNNRFSEPEATTSSHLWNAMQSVMNALNYKLEFNIKTMIDSWATQRYPFELKMKRNSKNGIIIDIQFYKLKEKDYYIPFTYTTESELYFNITWTDIIWITSWQIPDIIHLEKDEWIIFNLQQIGYYRVYYDTENWRKIGRYLNSKEYENIHVLNRAQIIDDAFHFAVEKELEFSVFWEIAKYLSKERDYIAWYPMIKAFEFMSNILVFSCYYPQFQEVLKQMEFLSLWNLFGEHNDYTECLKQEVAKWRCITEDLSCKTLAYNQLQKHLINLEKNKLSPGWKRWTYCNECLSYVENSEIRMLYLRTQVFDFKVAIHYEPTERDYALNVPILLFTLARNTRKCTLLEDISTILNNFKSIVQGRRVNKIAALIVIINNVYSMDQLDEITNFIEKEFQGMIISDFQDKILTRVSEIDRQIEFLYSFTD
ncbi:aminopeptidase N isoform X2 [Camponotus floridanus]|uniref:aminopeptidase N isoform X2 n=1 Tax=Camponotus floridanus TaxID=104421 RepID=UPI000DC68499|nr:aminopeptidase N isoform X2 [Camponotus floridanus]